MGVEVEVHHHGRRRQARDRHQFETLVACHGCDPQVLRAQHGAPKKTATFMPKPIVGDNGSNVRPPIGVEGQRTIRR
jgi:hypothetical protein